MILLLIVIYIDYYIDFCTVDQVCNGVSVNFVLRPITLCIEI